MLSVKNAYFLLLGEQRRVAIVVHVSLGHVVGIILTFSSADLSKFNLFFLFVAWYTVCIFICTAVCVPISDQLIDSIRPEAGISQYDFESCFKFSTENVVVIGAERYQTDTIGIFMLGIAQVRGGDGLIAFGWRHSHSLL